MQHTNETAFQTIAIQNRGRNPFQKYVNNSDIHYYHTFSKCILYAYKTFLVYYMHKVSPPTDTEKTNEWNDFPPLSHNKYVSLPLKNQFVKKYILMTQILLFYIKLKSKTSLFSTNTKYLWSEINSFIYTKTIVTFSRAFKTAEYCQQTKKQSNVYSYNTAN